MFEMPLFVIKRRETCETCNSLTSIFGVKTCKECGCSIWAKSMIRDAECPLDKWEKDYDKAN